MKGRSLLLSAILFLVAGVILILTCRTTSTANIVVVGGVMFIACGVLNILAYIAGRPGNKEIARAVKAGQKPPVRSSVRSALAWISSSASIILGLCLLVFTSTFTSLVPVVFALLIIFAALYQFYLLAIGCRPLKLPAWLFVVPVLMTGAAVYVFMQEPGNNESEHTGMLIMLITGISFVLFGAAMIVESVLIGSANRRIIKQARTPDTAADSHESVATDKNQVIEVKPLDDDPV